MSAAPVDDISTMTCGICGRDVSQAARSGPERYSLRCPTCPDEKPEPVGQLALFGAP